ncbi:MAG: hypothetical protein ACXV8U_22370, partial [Methylobacter sp.]
TGSLALKGGDEITDAHADDVICSKSSYFIISPLPRSQPFIRQRCKAKMPKCRNFRHAKTCEHFGV